MADEKMPDVMDKPFLYRDFDVSTAVIVKGSGPYRRKGNVLGLYDIFADYETSAGNVYKTLVADGFGTREEAQKFLDEYSEAKRGEQNITFVKMLKPYGLHDWHEKDEIVPVFDDQKDTLDFFIENGIAEIVKVEKL